MVLVNETDFVAPDRGSLGFRQVAARLAIDFDLAAVGPLQEAGQMQKRRLAGARRPDQGDDLARRDPGRGAAQDLQPRLPLHEGAFYSLQGEGRHYS